MKLKEDMVIVEIGVHHSSMGTSHIYKCGKDNGVFGGLPCPKSLRPAEGKRYLVTWMELLRNTKVKPSRNPYKHRKGKKK